MGSWSLDEEASKAPPGLHAACMAMG